MTPITPGRRDYKSLDLTPSRRETRVRHWLLGLAGVMIISSVFGLTPDSAVATREPAQAAIKASTADEALAVTAADTIRVDLELPPASTTAVPADSDQQATASQDDLTAWQTLTVKSGDSLARLFQKADIHPAQVLAVLDSGREARRLTRLHPGDTLRVRIDDEHRVTRLNYVIDQSHELDIVRRQDKLVSNLLTHPIESRHQLASGQIRSSLYNAALEAGLSDNLIMELAGIFGWDIDFALDIREGDLFTVLYEAHYKDGEKIDDGNILAAEFVNRGRHFRAVRYDDGNYYSPDGHSMRKAFLRSPVDFRRISSRFTPERYHPVLGKKRPHRGVDYAAASGTPIKAAGDGKIIFRGWKGGYGRTVIVQHGTHYTTLYAHMSRFRKGQGTGSRVRQGDTIGYVGKSGLATGPHLHYEFRLNGVHRNPLTVKLPQAQPIARQHREDFQRHAAPLLARLDTYQRNQLALNEPSAHP